MNKKQLLKAISELNILWNACKDKKADILIQMEQLLENYSQQNRKDIQILFMLAMVENSDPLADYIKATKYLKMILELEPNNIEALVCVAYILHSYSSIDTELYNKLVAARSSDKELSSLLVMACSWYLDEQGKHDEAEALLLESTKLSEGLFWNHYALGMIYRTKNNKNKSCFHFKKALQNITRVYTVDDVYDITNPQAFIESELKGLHLSQSEFELVQYYISEQC